MNRAYGLRQLQRLDEIGRNVLLQVAAADREDQHGILRPEPADQRRVAIDIGQVERG